MSRYSHTKEKYLLTFFGINDENSPDVVFAITNQGSTNYTSVPTITITPTPAIYFCMADRLKKKLDDEAFVLKEI